MVAGGTHKNRLSRLLRRSELPPQQTVAPRNQEKAIFSRFNHPLALWQTEPLERFGIKRLLEGYSVDLKHFRLTCLLPVTYNRFPRCIKGTCQFGVGGIGRRVETAGYIL